MEDTSMSGDKKEKRMTKTRTRFLALAISAAVLVTCLSVALAGTLAAPGDVSETFVSPYPSSYIPRELGATWTLNVIDAYTWASSDTNIARVTRNASNYTEATATALDYGAFAIIAGARNGIISPRTFFVRERSNIARYALAGGNTGYIANKNSGTLIIPISVWNDFDAQADLRLITWVSLDTDVARVDSSSRVVTAQGKDGYAVIRGECLDPWGVKHYILYRVAVGNVPNPLFTVLGITVTPDPASVNLGGTVGFTAQVQSSGSMTAPQDVTWELLGSAISYLTVASGGGTTLNVPAGETATTLTIRATSVANPSVFKNVTVTINRPTVSGVVISPKPAPDRDPGQSQFFSATVQGGAGVSQNVTWEVIGSESASGGTRMDGSTLIIAADERAPSLIVRATSVADPTKYDNVKVNLPINKGGVVVPPTGINLSGPDVAYRGYAQTYAATVLPAGANQNVTWDVYGMFPSGSGTFISNGVLYVAAGEQTSTLTIRATSVANASVMAEKEVQVEDRIIIPIQLVINGPASVEKGASGQYTVSTTPADASKLVNWHVFGASQGSTTYIDTNGVLHVGVNEASSSLTVRAVSVYNAAVSAERVVSVTAPNPTSVTVNAPNSVLKGSTTTAGQISATVLPAGASQAVTWSISGQQNAGTMINPSTGVLTIAVGEGAAYLTVTATSTVNSSISGYKSIQLIDVVIAPTNISITPTSTSMNRGDSRQFIATVTPSNASTTVGWQIVGSSSPGTTLNNGVLYISPTEAATQLTVRAYCVGYSHIYADAVVTINIPITEIPERVDGGILDGGLTGDGTWIEIARNGNYSLIVRKEVLPIGRVNFDDRTNIYTQASIRGRVNSWFNSTLSSGARLRNFTVSNDCLNKLGAFASLESYGYSKPTGTLTRTGNDVAFLLSFAEAASFCSMQYATSTTTFANSHPYAQANFNKLTKPGALTYDFWWLRSPGHYASTTTNSSVGSHSLPLADCVYANSTIAPHFVRPALWVHRNIFDSTK